MPSYTSYTLLGEVTEQLAGVKGTLAIANKSTAVPSQVVTIILDKVSGPSETVVLAQLGDSLTTDTEPYQKVTITADSYPALILFVVAPAHQMTVTSFSASIAGGVSSGAILAVLQESRVTVGAAAVEVAPLTAQQGLVVRADPANTATIYLGASNAVDATGWPLLPGESLPLDLGISLWAISTAAGQYLHVLQGA